MLVIIVSFILTFVFHKIVSRRIYGVIG